jgi:AbrB family looped-hinge helix DNA binding protein
MFAVKTATMSSKGQITVPMVVRRTLGLKTGERVDIYPRPDDTFVATIRRKSRIMDFAGDLPHLDQNRPKGRR